VILSIGTLPALAAPIGEAVPANDNAPPPERVRPLVRSSRRRPDTTYATAGNVILPLSFAERMPGWQDGPSARHPIQPARGSD
jgi:hypothetical protein